MTQTHRPTSADVIAWFKDEQARRVAAEVRIVTLEAALRRIRDEAGQVCEGCMSCIHAACRSSYRAWATADEALKATAATPQREENDG